MLLAKSKTAAIKHCIPNKCLPEDGHDRLSNILKKLSATRKKLEAERKVELERIMEGTKKIVSNELDYIKRISSPVESENDKPNVDTDADFEHTIDIDSP